MSRRSHQPIRAARTRPPRTAAGAALAAAVFSLALGALAFTGVATSAASVGTQRHVAPADISAARSAGATVSPQARPRWITVGDAVDVNAVSCSASGYCMLAGEAHARTDYGFVATINDGTVGKIVSVPGMVDVTAISCPQKDWCLVYGSGATVKNVTDDELAAVVNGKPVKAAVEVATNLDLTIGWGNRSASPAPPITPASWQEWTRRRAGAGSRRSTTRSPTSGSPASRSSRRQRA
jgi:hypothetical protein